MVSFLKMISVATTDCRKNHGDVSIHLFSFPVLVSPLAVCFYL